MLPLCMVYLMTQFSGLNFFRNCFLKYSLQAEEEEKKVEEQTEFLVRLVKFADDSKIKVIKEIKSVMEGINLVQVSQWLPWHLITDNNNYRQKSLSRNYHKL